MLLEVLQQPKGSAPTLSEDTAAMASSAGTVDGGEGPLDLRGSLHMSRSDLESFLFDKQVRPVIRFPMMMGL